jgi:hypothetical protein
MVLQVMGTWAASRFIPRAVSGGRTAWGETGELWGGRQRPQLIVYGLWRNVPWFRLRRPGNTTSGFRRENEGCELGHREHVGRQAIYESHRRASVALHSPCGIWLAVGLGAEDLATPPQPTPDHSVGRQLPELRLPECP